MKILHLLTFSLACAGSLPATAMPNVVLILADDLGGHDIGCYGSTFHQTPNLDALARRGMRFTNAYSASPLCSPTRSSILTGLAPARTGITAPSCHEKEVVLEKKLVKGNAATQVLGAASLTRLKTEYTTLAEVLRGAGWRTAHLGKWHLGAEPYSPLQQGFEIDLPHTSGPGPGGKSGYFGPWEFWKGEGREGEHIEDRMAEEAVKFIRAHRAGPFFLNYWAFSVHSPWMGKEDYAADAARRADPGSGQRNGMYAAMIRSLDEAVGRITAALDEAKLSGNTILIFSSDNGGWHNKPKATRMAAYAEIPVTSNAPFRSGKASLYEGGTRVPLIVVWPGKIAAGSASDTVVQSTDFFPTVLELAKLDKPAGLEFDGVSIAPVLRGGLLDREAVFCHFPHGGANAAVEIPGFKPGTWVRKGDWKLIRFYADKPDGSDNLELYNLRDDISETSNLASAKPELAAELNAQITEYLQRTEAVVPLRNPAWNPKAAQAAKGSGDPLQGWKARGCAGDVRNGILTVSKLTNAAFLGFAAGKHAGPGVIKLRIKAQPGASHLDWLPGGTKDQPKTVPFAIKGGDWEEISMAVPAAGPFGIVRIYLPKQDRPVEIDWIEISSKNSAQPTRTAF